MRSLDGSQHSCAGESVCRWHSGAKHTEASESGAEKGFLLHDARRRGAPTLKTPQIPKGFSKALSWEKGGRAW